MAYKDTFDSPCQQLTSTKGSNTSDVTHKAHLIWRNWNNLEVSFDVGDVCLDAMLVRNPIGKPVENYSRKLKKVGSFYRYKLKF